MDQNNLKTLLIEYQKIRERAEKELDIRKQQLYEQYPELEELDSKIQIIGISLSKSKLLSETEKSIELEEQLKILRNQKNEFIDKNSISSDMFNIKYNCPNCRDTGYLTNRLYNYNV